MAAVATQWETLKVDAPDSSGIAYIVLNRPSEYNTLTPAIFHELPRAISSLDADPAVRVIVLKGSGKHFCAGIDLLTFAKSLDDNGENGQDVGSGQEGEGAPDVGRIREKLVRNIKQMQAAFTALEDCRKPVIAAVHGACIGGGIDMITACDIRYCTQDSRFSVKEVDLAIVADLGTLQRLPRLIGYGNTAELSFTGRTFSGDEAKRLGLVQEVFPSTAVMDEKVEFLAREIASKSPLAVLGTKKTLLTSRDLSVAQGLEYVAAWNATLLMSSDVKEVVLARLEKRNPVFAKL